MNKKDDIKERDSPVVLCCYWQHGHGYITIYDDRDLVNIIKFLALTSIRVEVVK